MASIFDLDPSAIDPATDALTRPVPIPGIAHGSITGINGIVSPGIWDAKGGGTYGFPGYRFPDIQTRYDESGAPGETDIGSVQGRGTVSSIATDKNAIAESAAKRFNVTAPTRTAADFNDPSGLVIGGEAFAPTETPDQPRRVKTTSFKSDQAPNTPIGGAQERADPPPTMEQGNSGFQIPGLLRRAFENIGNWRDQNRLTLLALAGGLAGSQSIGQGIGRAFQGAAAVQPQQNFLNNQNATVQALVNRGMPPDMARAAASNPTIMQQIAPVAFGGKQWQWAKVGHDQYGQDIMGWVDPYTRTALTADGRPIGQGASGVQGGSGVSPDVVNLHGEDFLKTLDPARAAQIRSIGLGKQPFPSGMLLKTPFGQMLETQITQAYPDINAQTFPQRQKAFNDWYGGGKDQDAVAAVRQAATHGLALIGSMDRLGNFSVGGRLVNAPLNEAGDLLGTNTEYNATALNVHALADELSKIWKGGTNSDAEVRAWEEKFPINGTPAQQKAAMAKAVELYRGGIEKLQQKHKDSFGQIADDLPPILDPNTDARIRQMEDWSSGRPQGAPQQGQQVPPPQGRQIGQVYPTPRGPMRWMADGWHPVQ